MRDQPFRTMVLGLGNTILCDDGVGVYVAREIGKRINDPGISIREASVGGLELLDVIRGFNKIVIIDAIVTRVHKIGTIVKICVEDLKGGSAMARHQVGLYEALELGRELKMNLPQEITVYGIEVKDKLTFRESCTPEVEACITDLAEEIIRTELR